MTGSEKFELTVPSRAENLARIADFVTEVAANWGLSEQETFAVQMAVDEACTNIIQHGYGSQQEGPIEIACHRQDDDCVVTIRDYGRAFDPSAVPQPDIEAPLEQRQEGGLGLYFMRELMDEVRFAFNAQKGNLLTMVKRRRPVWSRPSCYDEAVTVVEARGRLDAAVATRLEAELSTLADQGKSQIVVDLEKASYISSSGLRVLLVAAKEARRRGGDLKLCCLSPRVHKIFDLAGFTLIFEIYESEEAATRAFQEGSPS